jgi:hypothetical protein
VHFLISDFGVLDFVSSPAPGGVKDVPTSAWGSGYKALVSLEKDALPGYPCSPSPVAGEERLWLSDEDAPDVELGAEVVRDIFLE